MVGCFQSAISKSYWLSKLIIVTLIIGAMCEKYAVQVADRRFSCNGKVVDDERDKTTLLICNNARFIVGFTGLAAYRTFDTHSWLLETLRDAGPPEFTPLELTTRFTAAATNYFEASPLLRTVQKRDKRVSFMFNGFVDHPWGAMPAALLVTNYQDWGKSDSPAARPEFRSTYFELKENWSPPLTWVQRIGLWQALRDDHNSLKELLRQRRPAAALTGKAVELIREGADRREAQGAIGKQLSSIVLPADFSMPATVGYHTALSTDTLHLPSMVTTTTATQVIISSAQLRSEEPSAGPLVVVRVARNHPCPCKSGKKYKVCHGKPR